MSENLEKMTSAEFEKVYNEIELPTYSKGEIVQGRVVEITKKFVAVDIGSKMEGYVDVKEIQGEAGDISIKPGSKIDVVVIGTDESDGALRLSKTLADKQKAIRQVEECFRTNSPIEGKVVSKIKGGFIVNIGMKAFLPASHVDIRMSNDYGRYLGKTFRFYITEYDRKKGEAVVSRKAYLEDERKRLKEHTLKIIEKGRVFDGTVKNVLEFGAFVDIGGMEGLLHISDIAWGKIKHPSEILQQGDKIKVMVLDFNRETEKLSLGIKQLTPSPWEFVEEKYPAGTKVQGTVTGLTDFGAFVEVEPGVEGLIKVSEIFWGKKLGKPSSVLKIGDKIEAMVLEVNAQKKRMSLSLKQFLPNPLEELEKKYPSGTKITGKIKGITDFGIFVEIEDGYEGLVHITDVTWSKTIPDLNKTFRIGDNIEVVVLKIDHAKERISLGIKQLSPDPWKIAKKLYKPGTDVKAVVSSVMESGIMVDLEAGLKGLIPQHELDIGEREITEVFAPGAQIEARVIEMNIKEERIGLSIKALERARQKMEVEKYMKTTEGATMKLGELILNSFQEGKKASS